MEQRGDPRLETTSWRHRRHPIGDSPLTDAASGHSLRPPRARSGANVLDQIVPHRVVVAESRGDLPDAVLLAEEEPLVQGMAPARGAEATTVRHLAREAMAGLGCRPVALLRGARNAPTWPSGVVGSITHCPGYRAAAVAPSETLSALGIDAEPNLPVTAGVLRRIASRGEADDADRLAATVPGVAWGRLLFCAKEAFYKAWSPLTGRALDFRDVEVAVSASGRLTFDAARPAVRAVARRMSARWLAQDGLLAVVAWIGNDLTNARNEWDCLS